MPHRTTSNLFWIGDVAQLRGTAPPVPAIVLAVRGDRVRVGYYGADGQPVRSGVTPAALVQATMQSATTGIPAELEALREGTLDLVLQL